MIRQWEKQTDFMISRTAIRHRAPAPWNVWSWTPTNRDSLVCCSLPKTPQMEPSRFENGKTKNTGTPYRDVLWFDVPKNLHLYSILLRAQVYYRSLRVLSLSAKLFVLPISSEVERPTKKPRIGQLEAFLFRFLSSFGQALVCSVFFLWWFSCLGLGQWKGASTRDS